MFSSGAANSLVTEKEVVELQQCFSNGGVNGCQSYLESKQSEWKKLSINIGVVGNSGAGKSTLINTIRGLSSDDVGAAKTGVVETTKRVDIRSYAHPNNPELKFWDLPGVGTPKFPRDSYLADIKFDRFDFFLVIAYCRFTDNELWLGNEITQRKKRFFYIRTKVDLDITNHNRTNNPESAVSILNRIRKDIVENLNKFGKTGVDETNIFLIDALDRNAYDFRKLEEALVQDFPSLKRQALLFSMNAFSTNMVKLKVAEIKKRIWKSSALSAAAAMIPVPGVSTGVDFALVLHESEFFFKTLGLDQESLRRTAIFLQVDFKILQSIVDKNFSVGFFSFEGIKVLISLIPSGVSNKLAQEFARYIPFIGTTAAAGLSFTLTYALLEYIVYKMETVALEILEVAVRTPDFDSAK